MPSIYGPSSGLAVPDHQWCRRDCRGDVEADSMMRKGLTLKRHNITLVIVPQLKRATVYFDPSLHQALRVKAAHTGRSLSELVNAAVRETLGEDAQDLATFAGRAKETTLSFEEVLKDLKRRGKL
jgi:plasmid stability protein